MEVRGIILPSALIAAAAVAGVSLAQPSPSGPPPSPPAGGDHTLTLTNSGGQTVSAVSVAPTGSLDFSDDLLGNQVASVGKTVRLKVKDPAGQCVFDVQFLLNDGTAVTRKGINLCQTASYTFSR